MSKKLEQERRKSFYRQFKVVGQKKDRCFIAKLALIIWVLIDL